MVRCRCTLGLMKARARRSRSLEGEASQLGGAFGARRMAKAYLRTNSETATVSLAALKQHPETASSVPTQVIPALVAELASEQATLSALQGLLTARLLHTQSPTGGGASDDDRLMTADEVAVKLGVPKRWVQRRARRLPFARLISAHAVRYSAAGLRRWLEHRRVAVKSMPTASD